MLGANVPRAELMQQILHAEYFRMDADRETCVKSDLVIYGIHVISNAF